MYRIALYGLLPAVLFMMGAKGCDDETGAFGFDGTGITDPLFDDTQKACPSGGDDHRCDGDGCSGRRQGDDFDGDGRPNRCAPRCDDLGRTFFGPCGKMLGFGVAYGQCERIEGCKEADVRLFDSRSACRKACLEGPSPVTAEKLCEETGGSWDPNSCGHYFCGQFPPCDAIIPGCDCGAEMNFVEGRGCVISPACGSNPTCTDLWGIDFGQCKMLMGYAVIDGACRPISGCDPMGYSFFASLENCRNDCEGSCDDNGDCGAGKYCHFTLDSHCGAYHNGNCRGFPQYCPNYYDPVCGCDGQTYGNECDAGNQGVSVVLPGECPTPTPHTL